MLKKLERLLPHGAILICNMYIVFFLIDRVNQAMNFIDNGLTKGLLLILCAIALFNDWRLLKPAPVPVRRNTSVRQGTRTAGTGTARRAYDAPSRNYREGSYTAREGRGYRDGDYDSRSGRYYREDSYDRRQVRSDDYGRRGYRPDGRSERYGGSSRFDRDGYGARESRSEAAASRRSGDYYDWDDYRDGRDDPDDRRAYRGEEERR